MAHECPNCGLLCHCNGDIDDICLNLDEDVNKCNHCLENDDDDWMSDDEDFDIN